MAGLLILGVAIFLLMKTRSNPAGVPYPEANQPLDPATPDSYTPLNDHLTEQIAFDVQSGNVQTLKVGEVVISTAFTGAATAAGQSATGVLLFSVGTWTVIGGIVAAAFAVIQALRSNTHLYADAVVQNYENPFGQYWNQAIAVVDRGWQADGSLSSLDVKSIYNALFVAWNNYRAAMLELIGRGGDWEIVAKQSLFNLNEEFAGERLSNGRVLTPGSSQGGAFGTTGYVNFWLNWTQGRIEYLESIGR
jgi:hypothetical protein